MAGLPDPLERRNLLQPDAKRTADFAAIAERYLAEERKSEALDFIEKVEDTAKRDALRARVREGAVALGDSFLLARLAAVTAVDDADLRKALESAKAQGKTRHAIKLARRLGDTALVEQLEVSIGLRPAAVAIIEAAPGTVGTGTPALLVGEPKKQDGEGTRTV